MDIVERLYSFCIDWDGKQLPMSAEPMDGLHCCDLYNAAVEIDRLRHELAEANERAAENLRMKTDELAEARRTALEEAAQCAETCQPQTALLRVGIARAIRALVAKEKGE